MKDIIKKKLIILGSGPAGYTAGVYAARAGLEPCLITGMEQGGQLTTTTDVENWPGDSDGLQGPDLMDRMLKHVESLEVEVLVDHIEKVDIKKSPFQLQSYDKSYACESLIIATGASAKYLGLSSEEKYFNGQICLPFDVWIPVRQGRKCRWVFVWRWYWIPVR